MESLQVLDALRQSSLYRDDQNSYILYPNRKPGKFIYIKSTFFKQLSADMYGYKQNQPEFPDEPTSDQFFDEKQFEAYRELGYQTAWQMMENDEVKKDAIIASIMGD